MTRTWKRAEPRRGEDKYDVQDREHQRLAEAVEARLRADVRGELRVRRVVAA